MNGTEKQLTWATDLQKKAISVFEWARLNPPDDGKANPARWNEGVDLLVGRIRSATHASHVIDAFSIVNFSKPSDETFMTLISVLHSRFDPCKF